MPDNYGGKARDFVDIIDLIMDIGGELWSWGIGILISLGIALWVFRNPLARMIFVLAALAGVAAAVWLLFGRKNQNVVAVAVGGAVLLAVLPIHGYAESRPSKANFCRTYLAGKRRYLARYSRMTGDPLRDLANGIGAMSSWVPMFDRLAKAAPDEIQSDVEHIRDSLEAQQHAAGQAASDPFGALGASLLSSLMAMDSWERVGNYVDENCEPHQNVQAQSVQATAATDPPTTTSAAIDDTTDTTDTAGTTDTTGPPVELAASATADASTTAPDSVDAGGNPISYPASNIVDGDAQTAWRAADDGHDVTVTLTLPNAAHLTQVGLIPGYAKLDPADRADRFHQERRILEVRWRFDDGSTLKQRFADQPAMQHTAVDVTTTSVTVEIVATRPGNPDYDYTPISEVSLIGIA